MSQQAPHPMYATPNHDELSRESFVRELMVHVTRDLMPGKKKLYEAKVKPAFLRAHNRPPKDRHEVRKAMEEEDFNQVWGALRRTTQEMMFDVIGESVERQLPDLIDRAGRIGSKLGRLTLDPDLEIPRYHTAVDIHCKPGGYHTEIADNDVFAGAEYDRSYNLFAMGASGPQNDDMGRSVGAFANVRNDLHGAAQELAPAFPGQNILVDPARGDIVALPRRHPGEALVMAKVQVRLRAIIGDVDFAVLEGIHGSRIDVQIGVQLAQPDRIAPGLQQGAQGRRGQTFAEG